MSVHKRSVMVYDGVAERLRHLANDLEQEGLSDHARILREAVDRIYSLPLYAGAEVPS